MERDDINVSSVARDIGIKGPNYATNSVLWFAPVFRRPLLGFDSHQQ